jgi:hypothetical protein
MLYISLTITCWEVIVSSIKTHSSINSLVNRPILEGRICGWLLLFKEFSFEVVVKPGKHNVGPYNF